MTSQGPINPAARAIDADASLGFIQLRLRIDGTRLLVLDARHLPGKLIEDEGVHLGTGYEVTIDGQRIALGSVPDVGLERRSYPNLAGPPEQQGHHVTRNPHPEFVVRIPTERLRRVDPAAIEVTLHELTSFPPIGGSARALRAADLRSVTRPIASLDRAWFAQLPAQQQAALRAAVPQQ
jgi:hypothetical protein